MLSKDFTGFKLKGPGCVRGLYRFLESVTVSVLEKGTCGNGFLGGKSYEWMVLEAGLNVNWGRRVLVRDVGLVHSFLYPNKVIKEMKQIELLFGE